MDYRDEMVRQRIKHLVEQGGYFQQNESRIRLYVALVVIGLVIGCGLHFFALH